MDDVGIYRISGLSAEIQKLKRGFEKCKCKNDSSNFVVITLCMLLNSILKCRHIPDLFLILLVHVVPICGNFMHSCV